MEAQSSGKGSWRGPGLKGYVNKHGLLAAHNRNSATRYLQHVCWRIHDTKEVMVSQNTIEHQVDLTTSKIIFLYTMTTPYLPAKERNPF